MLLIRAARSLCLRAKPVLQSRQILVRLLSVRSKKPDDTNLERSSHRERPVQRSNDTHSTQATSVRRDGATLLARQHQLRHHIAKLGMQMRGREVLLVLESARSKGLALNVYIYAAAITALGHCKQYQQALKLLAQMEQESIAPNVVVYNSLINACSKSGQWQKALELLKEMLHKGLLPDVTSYNSTIDACSKGKQW